MQRRLLCVDDEEVIRVTLSLILSKHGFEVSTAASVAEALQKITSETFDVLLSDLNIGNPGDGLTVVSAMRRTQPKAVTIILTGYPAFETALEAIRQQVDDYVVKPADIPGLVKTIESKLATRARGRKLPPPKRVAMLLQENLERIENLWLSSVENDNVPSQVTVHRKQRLDRFRRLIKKTIRAAQYGAGQSAADRTDSTVRVDTRREFVGYTPRMILAEFCLLRRVIEQIVQENLLTVNLSYLIPDLARVNEILDERAQEALTEFSEYITTTPE